MSRECHRGTVSRAYKPLSLPSRTSKTDAFPHPLRGYLNGSASCPTGGIPSQLFTTGDYRSRVSSASSRLEWIENLSTCGGRGRGVAQCEACGVHEGWPPNYLGSNFALKRSSRNKGLCGGRGVHAAKAGATSMGARHCDTHNAVMVRAKRASRGRLASSVRWAEARETHGRKL